MGKGGILFLMVFCLLNIVVICVENFCVSGLEVFCGVVYVVVVGVVDIVFVVGIEKLKDIGYGGLFVVNFGILMLQVVLNGLVLGNFVQFVSVYRVKYNVSKEDLKWVIVYVFVKSYDNGVKNLKVYLWKFVIEE